MKKIFAILVLCCYSAGVFGIDISLHYCGGSIQSISINGKDEDGCCGKKKKRMRCCKDKNFSYKLSEKHAAQHITHSHAVVDMAAILPSVYTVYQSSISLPEDKYIPVSHAPPDSSGPAIYLLHSVLLI